MGFDERDPDRCLHEHRDPITKVGNLAGNLAWHCRSCQSWWTNDYGRSTDVIRVPAVLGFGAYANPTGDEYLDGILVDLPDDLDQLQQDFGY